MSRSKRIKLDVSSAPIIGNDGIFTGMCFYLLPTGGLSKSRRQLFQKQIIKNGGLCLEAFEAEEPPVPTHMIVDENLDADGLSKIVRKIIPESMKVVRCMWVSQCLKDKKTLDTDKYEIVMQKPKLSDTKAENLQSDITHSKNNPSQVAAGSNSKLDCIETDTSNDSSPDTSPMKQLPEGSWTCTQSSLNKAGNLNCHITEILEEMIKVYDVKNDKWRAFGYQKAVSALKKYPVKVTTWKEAMSIPGVGKKLADKIWEIIESGGLRKLDELSSEEDTKLLQLFSNVWGAGAHTAHTWIQMGCKSLDDVKQKAKLTRQQEVGLRFYDDILDRMPREEAAGIESIVKTACTELNPGLIAMACGSYRRGKPTCGDVDILITHPDGKSHKGVFTQILNKLRAQGFLTDDLAYQEDTGNQKKYLGVCKLPGEEYRRHRRLDIIVVPYDEFGCALVYFTGSAYFNRSLRQMCKKMGMSLNEHALKVGVVRKGNEKINQGTKVPTPTEESVFTTLNVPFRPPEERDH